MPYQVVSSESAERELKSLSAEVARLIGQRLRGLADEQHPMQSRRLKNSRTFRLRVGDYRAIYTVDDAMQIVTILAVGHRSMVYRDR